MGEIYLRNKEYAKAIEYLKRVLLINKEDPECLILLSKVH